MKILVTGAAGFLGVGWQGTCQYARRVQAYTFEKAKASPDVEARSPMQKLGVVHITRNL